MGILEDLLGSAMGDQGGMGGPARQAPAPAPAGGGMNSVLMALLPVVLSMLASRGSGAGQPAPEAGGGGLGDILGQVLGGGAQRGGGGGMGDILGQVLGGGAQRGGGGGMGDILGQVLGGGAGGGAGGLGGLLEQMQRAGAGEQARSWVGTGQNLPISPDVLGQIFGQGGIEEIARQAGVSPQQASTGLSELLPEVVNHVTPDGQVPDLDQLALSVGSMRRRMGA